MSGAHGVEPDPRRQPTLTVLAIGSGLLAVVLAMLGFAEMAAHHPEEHAHENWADHLYWTLQLFALHGHHLEHPAPPTLQAARFLAAFTSLAGAFLFLRAALGRLAPRFELALARLLSAVLRRPLLRRSIVVGSGPLAESMAESLRSAGERVWTVDPAGGGTAEAFGDRELDAMNAHLARRVLLVDRDDGRNVERASRVVRYFERRRPPEGLTACFHVSDPDLARALRARRFSTASAVRATLVDVYENTARDLLERFPLDWRKPDADESIELVVLGYGRMAQSLVLQAARLGHFAGGRRLRVRVFDPRAASEGDAFRLRYPDLNEVVDVEFVPASLRDPKSLARIAALARDPARIATLAFCLGEGAQNVVLACDLLDPEEDPLRARALVHLGSSALEGVELPKRAHSFRVEQGFPWADRSASEVERLARAIHADFVERRRAEGRPADDPSMAPWESLDEDLRDSNREQAAHIPVKLRALDLRIVDAPMQPFEAFEPDEVELLAAMEHERWRAERYLAGWRHGAVKSVPERVSPHLVPWSELTEAVRDYDREAVRNIPALVRSTGRSITR